jgi:hypothetical protein
MCETAHHPTPPQKRTWEMVCTPPKKLREDAKNGMRTHKNYVPTPKLVVYRGFAAFCSPERILTKTTRFPTSTPEAFFTKKHR